MDFVLDASAMIALLRKEPGFELVRRVLLTESVECFAHALNLCEVYYDFHRASGHATAIAALDDLARAGVHERAYMVGSFGSLREN